MWIVPFMQHGPMQAMQFGEHMARIFFHGWRHEEPAREPTMYDRVVEVVQKNYPVGLMLTAMIMIIIGALAKCVRRRKRQRQDIQLIQQGNQPINLQTCVFNARPLEQQLNTEKRATSLPERQNSQSKIIHNHHQETMIDATFDMAQYNRHQCIIKPLL
jgi:hypothetical protein